MASTLIQFHGNCELGADVNGDGVLDLIVGAGRKVRVFDGFSREGALDPGATYCSFAK